jgi:hypothetical protein
MGIEINLLFGKQIRVRKTNKGQVSTINKTSTKVDCR